MSPRAPLPSAPVAESPRSPAVAHVSDEPAGPFAPSRARAHDDRDLTANQLADVDRCVECHREVFAQWSGSTHRYSSLDNPYYAAAFFAVRRERGPEASRWCGGCHDPALLFARDLDAPTIDRANERARLGVGCVLCHSIERVHDRTGNANYTLAAGEPAVPERVEGGYRGVEAHRAQVGRPALRDDTLCMTCHKVGIPEAVNGDHWLRGQNDFDPWDQSAFAGRDVERLDPDAPRARCVDCHMPREPARLGDASAAAHGGLVRSHRALGGHTALAAFNRDTDALARQRAFLRGVARIDLLRGGDEANSAALLRGEELHAGGELSVDVVLVNERVGHRFPAGTADVADVWVELTLRDARGALVAHSGLEGAQGTDDEDAHRLLVRPIDENGRPALLRDPHRYRAVAYDTTLPPRAARVVRYALRIPAGAMGPFALRARLLHRRLLRGYELVACEAAQRELGRPCPTQPVTEVASVEVSAARAGDEATAPWRRLYDHGRAIAEAETEERVGAALPVLEASARLAPERAEPLVERARALARQGRTDEALRALDEAERLAPGAPAISYLRGQFAVDVWRFATARAPLERAWSAVPESLRASEMFANVLGLAGDHERAFAVVQRALERDPERPALLHYQLLELTALGAPAGELARAERAWERHRPVDRASSLRGLCRRDVPGCAREAMPVHTHELRVSITPR